MKPIPTPAPVAALLAAAQGAVFATSQHIAKQFEKTHNHVIRDIEAHLTGNVVAPPGFFTRSSYVDSGGRTCPCYDLSKDGFILLAFGYTGSRAMGQQLDYIARFNAMTDELAALVPPIFKSERYCMPATNLPALKPEVFIRDGNVFATSLNVAAQFDREHRNVLRDIDVLVATAKSEENSQESEMLSGEQLVPAGFFVPSSYTVEGGQTYRSYELSKNGFNLLAMGFKGRKALAYKISYISAFDAMETLLRAQQEAALTLAAKPAAKPRVKGSTAAATARAPSSAQLREARLTAEWGLRQLPHLSDASRQMAIASVLDMIDVHLPAPVLDSNLYDCNAVCKLLDMSSYHLPRDPIYKRLKQAPYGQWVGSKDGNGNDRPNWNWNELGVSMLIAAFSKPAEASGPKEPDDTDPRVVRFNQH